MQQRLATQALAIPSTSESWPRAFRTHVEWNSRRPVNAAPRVRAESSRKGNWWPLLATRQVDRSPTAEERRTKYLSGH
jgi:hypothetical protein